MSDEKPKSQKWSNPPEGYKLKSDLKAICEAAIEKWEGQAFGEFYVQISRDMLDRLKKYSDVRLSPKQEAIYAKLEVNVWPEGLKNPPEEERGHFGSGHATKPDDFELPF